MTSPKLEPMQRIKVWLPNDINESLTAKSSRDGISKSEIVRQALAKHLGEESAASSAPWLESMIDAVLAKYFQGFPQVLEKLITAAYGNEEWHKSAMLKLIELVGDKDHKSQDARVAKVADKIHTVGWEKAGEFFQGISGPSEMIESEFESD